MGRPCVRSTGYWKNSSEVGEKAGYPVYQPCKKETDGVHSFMYIVTGFRPFPLSIQQVTTTTLSTTKKSQFVPSFRRFYRRHPHFRSYHKHQERVYVCSVLRGEVLGLVYGFHSYSFRFRLRPLLSSFHFHLSESSQLGASAI